MSSYTLWRVTFTHAGLTQHHAQGCTISNSSFRPHYLSVASVPFSLWARQRVTLYSNMDSNSGHSIIGLPYNQFLADKSAIRLSIQKLSPTRSCHEIQECAFHQDIFITGRHSVVSPLWGCPDNIHSFFLHEQSYNLNWLTATIELFSGLWGIDTAARS